MKRFRFFLARQLVKRYQYPLYEHYARLGDTPEADPTDCNGEHCDCLSPPAEFVQACAPCKCKGTNLTAWDGMNPQRPCPDCRVELVGPCWLYIAIGIRYGLWGRA